MKNELKRIRQEAERGDEMPFTWHRDGASEYLQSQWDLLANQMFAVNNGKSLGDVQGSGLGSQVDSGTFTEIQHTEERAGLIGRLRLQDELEVLVRLPSKQC